MTTVLITYSAPPPPTEGPGSPAGPGSRRSAHSAHSGQPSVAATTAGIDEAIAAAIADELARSGHHVTCRPCVAITTTDGFDLVVSVDRLHVRHSSGEPARLVHPADPHPSSSQTSRPSSSPDAWTRGGQSTIPMTWSADWRAVDAWARSVADHLANFLAVRGELARVRSELDRCRAMLRAVTPEPRPMSAVELGRPAAHDGSHPTARGTRAGRRLTPAGS